MLTSGAGGVRERGTRRRGRGRGRGWRRRCAESDGSRAAADDDAGRRQRRSRDLGEVAVGEERTTWLS